jgi:hypothetical protein
MTGTLIMALIFAWGSIELAPRAGLAIGAAFALVAALIAGSGVKALRSDDAATNEVNS